MKTANFLPSSENGWIISSFAVKRNEVVFFIHSFPFPCCWPAPLHSSAKSWSLFILTCVLFRPKYFSNISFSKTLENIVVPFRIRITVQIKKKVPAGETNWLKRNDSKQYRHGNHYPVRAGHPKPCTAAWAGFTACAHCWAASQKTLSVPQLACTHLQELKPHAVRSSCSRMLCMWEILQLWVIFAYIHVLLSTREGKRFHSRKEKI